MMPTTMVAVRRCSCGARLARDQSDTVCSPCRRGDIESSAHRGAAIARDREGIEATFNREGLNGVAVVLDCTLGEALDVLFVAQLLPAMSVRRQALLRQLVALGDVSHVVAADLLGISRWTVATYRGQLGLEKITASASRPRDW